MGKTNLVAAKVYLTVGEYDEIKNVADDEGVTVSAVLRARLGLPHISRGAPQGNKNRTGGNTSKVARKVDKRKRGSK